jgi:hypothetical protein
MSPTKRCYPIETVSQKVSNSEKFVSNLIRLTHRNLSTRTSKFALVQQTFLAKKTCKNSADLHPIQGNLLQRNIFPGLNKLPLQHKIGLETS